MNGVGDIERTEVSLATKTSVQSFNRYCGRHLQGCRRARARETYLAKGTRTKIDSIIVAEADERAIGRSINSDTDDGRL